MSAKPEQKPQRPYFSSGPCAKFPGWSLEVLKEAALGRSHRAKIGKVKLQRVIESSKALLGIPEDYLLAVMPGSDTGAFEAALWSLLGARGIDILAWESFGQGWVTDVTKQLKLDQSRVITAPYGTLPDLSQIDWTHDVVFTWNGTTSGVKVPDGEWIASDRQGLSICDATSAVFATEIPWEKLDVVTWSWQKVLGGEAAHGMLALSPRAVERLEHYKPDWPLPKIFRLTKGGKLISDLFSGATINTPSMMAVEDVLAALDWAKSIGGLPSLINRSTRNLTIVSEWVEKNDWVDFLAQNPDQRSSTSICLKLTADWVTTQDVAKQAVIAKRIAQFLEDEGVAYDIGSYRDAPPGLRIWGGATVEPGDVQKLLPWLDWAYQQVQSAHHS